MKLYDAHNHLQDPRLESCRDEVVATTTGLGLVRMVVNGSCEDDWEDVLTLAQQYDCVLPSLGVHPWYVKDLPDDWQQRLTGLLDQSGAFMGEIGLDRWIKDADLPAQERVFRWQLALAAERNLPVSIHCLKAWGRLLEILQSDPLPSRGFLLHSYGGPVEMVKPLAERGAYFSISGYFAHERKAKQRETFRQVPRERLLLETDAPDMWPPPEWNRYPLKDPTAGKDVNHPANIVAVYEFVAKVLNETVEELAKQIETNFERLFHS